jgi:hypothetical protein
MQKEQVDPVGREKERNIRTQEGTQDITEENFKDDD